MLGHSSVSLTPAEFAKASTLSVATRRATALLLVVGMSTTTTAANVRGLLLLAHARSSLGHDYHL